MGLKPGGSSWQNREAGVVSGFKNLDATINFTKEKTNVRFKLYKPTVQTVGTACACPGDVLRETYLDLVVRYDKNDTQADRDSVLQDIKDLVLTTQFAAYVKDLTITV
jgi:hypothetical protein